MATKTKKPVRIIELVPSYGWDHDYFYRVRSRSLEGEVLYHSQRYSSKRGAKLAAIREHEGRSKFDYRLVYPDRNGDTVTEKLK